MLKRLAIFGVLLAVSHTFAPVPWQAAENPAGSSSKVHKQEAPDKSTGQPAVSPLPENGARPTAQDAEKPDAENAGNSVTVRKLPTVSIGKDWADWSYWGFGGLLVVVGGSQVWFLYRTLKAIQTQAAHMERQTIALEDSVAAAQKSADAALAQVEMMKSKERAQIRIEFANLEIAFDKELGGYPIHFKVILDGTTRAYILEDSIAADIPSYPMEDRKYWARMGLPNNFTPEMSPFEGYTLLRTNEFPPELEQDNMKIGLVLERKLSVRIHGAIRYRDIFGDSWLLKIHRAWSHYSRMWAGAGKDGDDERVQANEQSEPD